MSFLQDSEVEELAGLLGRLNVGELPLSVFQELARLMVLPAVEIIPLFLDDDGELHVLMTQRPDNDPIWPGQWHTPGRILRPNEVDDTLTYNHTIGRLIETEFPGVRHGQAVFVENEFRRVRRGTESAALHWMELLEGTVPVGKLFPIRDLPTQMIDHHGPMIRKVAAHYLQHKG